MNRLGIIDIEEDPEQVVEIGARTYGNVRLTVTPEVSEQLRLGYRCANCMERFDIPWPRFCSFCGVNVREQQADFFARQFRGVEEFHPTDWDAEIERMREVHEREQKEKR